MTADPPKELAELTPAQTPQPHTLAPQPSPHNPCPITLAPQPSPHYHPMHQVALAESLAPEALLLLNRLRLTPIGLAVVLQHDRLVDALERAVLARLQVTLPLVIDRAAHLLPTHQPPALSSLLLLPLPHSPSPPLPSHACMHVCMRVCERRMRVCDGRWCSSSCTRPSMPC